jgi:alkylated DNA nucleotide flippase Atl1
VRDKKASVAAPVALSDAGLRERQDIQEWVINHPEVLGENVLIVTAEFDRWASDAGGIAKERLDVLGLDASGRLVVVELKRDSDSKIHLQAITYAALVAGFTEEALAAVHADFLTRRGKAISTSEALIQLRDHVEGEIQADVLAVPRIILLAGSHPAQVVTSADWLTRQGLDVELREIKAFRFNDDIAVTFDQIYPVPGVESMLLVPARKQAKEAVEKADRQGRSANAVRLIVENRLIEDGSPLTLQPTTEVTSDVRDLVSDWVDEQPNRGRATWINDISRPICWEADNQQWKPTSLVRHILTEAAGLDRSVRGTSWWITTDGDELPVIAGIASATGGRDWSDLHDLITVLNPGEWTSYGDLGEVLGVPARPVGTHIGRCQECPPGAWRVLQGDGKPSDGFRWPDSGEQRSVIDVLIEEGLNFDPSGKASIRQRVSADALAGRLRAPEVQ